MLTVRRTTGALFVALVASLAACGSADAGPEDSVAGPRALAVVVGAHANSPGPELAAGVQDLMRTAVEDQAKAAVVVSDGRPSVQQLNLTYKAKNGDGRKKETTNNLTILAKAVRNAKATTAENDLLGAIDLGARTVAAATGPKSIIVIDNGLQTVAPIKLQDPGMLDADPKDVADFLEKSDALPALTGTTVVLSGLGDTKEPQGPLTHAQRANLVTLWTTVLKRAGAQVTVLDQPLTSDATTEVPPVTPVDVSTTTTFQTTVADGTNAQPIELGSDIVAFEPDRAVFRDAADVEEGLRPLAEQIVTQQLAVNLTGTAASSGTAAGRAALSLQRAAAVKQTLIKLGVDAAVITTKGVGSDWPGHIKDVDAKGRLMPGPAALNRKVIVELIQR